MKLLLNSPEKQTHLIYFEVILNFQKSINKI